MSRFPPSRSTARTRNTPSTEVIMTGKTYSTEEMLARLIAFDTTSRDGNIPLIEFVEDYLDGWGVPHFRVDYEANTQDQPLRHHRARHRGRHRALGPHRRGAGRWPALDQRSLRADRARATRLFGRGTCDMKGFLAVCLAEVPNFLKARAEVAHPPRALLRRGGGLQGRAPARRPHARQSAEAARRHRRRAHLDEGGQRPQECRHLLHRGHGP